MEKKYWVPALERADAVVEQIALQPGEFRLIDLANKLEVNKSSMYSLLNTLEVLGWIRKNENEKYLLGPVLGLLGTAYINQYDILDAFSAEAKKSVEVVDEHIQLGKLHGGEVFYLAREEGSSPARLITDPGTRYPAYAAAIGKVQLIHHSYEDLTKLFPQYTFEKKTEKTVENVEYLWDELVEAKRRGYVTEEQEGAVGFCCVSAPVYDSKNQILAGVSFTMLESNWQKKKELAVEEIIKLANRLSVRNGYKETVNLKEDER